MPSHRPFVFAFAAAALVLGLSRVVAAAEPTPPLPGPFEHIRVVDFPGEIEGVLAAYTIRQADQAVADGVDCLVLRIDSPGGTVFHSMKIADHLLSLPDSIHVVAWVPEMAYSGASMVSLSCDEIVMGASAHLGDSQPGTPSPEGWTPAGEKIETVLRAKFREYASRNHYPIPLAEAMVSERMEVLRVRDPDGGLHYVRGEDFRDAAPDAEVIAGYRRRDLLQVGAPVVRKGELLTMTADEARDYGFVRRTFDGRLYPRDEADLLAHLEAPGATVEKVGLSFSERTSRVLMNFSGVLSAVVAVAFLLFLWKGPGVITIIGGAALVLLLLINATADQLNGFPLLLLFVGVLLLGVEIFVIPGFGVTGVLGILLIATGFLFLAAGATFDGTGSLSIDLVVDFGLQFLLTVLAGLLGLFLLSRWIPFVGPGRRLVLAAPGASPVRLAPAGQVAAVGDVGRSLSTLRPAGTAEFEGRLVDVVTDGDFIAPGQAVRVVGVEGNRVTVRATGRPVADDEEE